MKEGFTLIELLAVIVILAIIALIATPIILEVINNTKEEAVVRSAENYLNAVELSIATEAMNDSTKKLDGTYQIISNGKEIQKGTETPIKVDYDGEGLEKGKITIKDGKIKRVMNGKIGNQTYVKTLSGETMILDYESEEVTLLSGQNFNSAIKTLVLGNGTTVAYNTADETVTSIEFLSYGMLPEGYTLKDLDDMDKTNVSAGNDNKIMAYYDGNDKVFIYSEGLINFNQDSNSMFMVFKNVEKIIFNEIDTSQVKYMQSMFHTCINLINLDLRVFETSSVKNMSGMFESCESLEKIDLSSFNTNAVTIMGSMFRDCISLKKLDLSNFDTLGASVDRMFQDCTSLEELDVSNFDTTGATNMLSMFGGCNNLTSLDLSSFNTSDVNNMNYMFANTWNLQDLNISNFTFSDSLTAQYMFANANKTMNIVINKTASEYFIEKGLHKTATIIPVK